MADVTCPLTREDRAALLADDALSSQLRTLLEDPERTIELAHGYELRLTEFEANALLAYAQEHQVRQLASALQQEVNGLMRRLREKGQHG
jgi:hypothetical protein